MQLGLIKKDGKIQAYKMPEHDVHKIAFREKEIKEQAEKQQLKLADFSLDFRARWLVETVGYGDSSCNIKEGDRMPSTSKIPIGCEIPELVARSIAALNTMKHQSKTSRSYVMILNIVSFNRRENESIVKMFRRLEMGFSYKQYLAARRMYANILSSQQKSERC